MTFITISNEGGPFLQEVQYLYEDTFPLFERRRWEDLMGMLQGSEMNLQVVLEQQAFIGFIIWWKLEHYFYLEHLAVEASQRGKQYGKRIMQHVIRQSSPFLFLETELPLLEDADKRIQFYQKLGLKKVPYPYVQPPYRRNGSPVPMLLMSLQLMESREEFDRVVGLLRERVYEKFW